MANLRSTLYAWRDAEAAKRGVELFRILPNQTLDEIVRSLPRTKEELTAIKGIKDAKYNAYGKILLALVDEHANGVGSHPSFVSSAEGDSVSTDKSKPEDEETAFSVSDYLDIINRELYRLRARVRGEITSLKIQGRSVYIGLKDAKDDSSLSVFMWANDFDLAGVTIEEGMDVIVEGRSEIYKPNGRFNFRAETVELVGEGALKKAYDELHKRLSSEGVFLEEKKRPLPEYPERIGLITSKQGAVIHDFLNNLGKFGYKIRFTDSRVEGVVAVKDILAALKYFSTQEIDVLVLIRGGGSLESLQAFNNEHVVRAIANFPKPTIVAIGHDKDTPLAQLSADLAPSTPTAATALLNQSWEEGVHAVRYFTKDIMSLFHEQLWIKTDQLRMLDDEMQGAYKRISELFIKITEEFYDIFVRTERVLVRTEESLDALSEQVLSRFTWMIEKAGSALSETSRMLTRENPLRQLRLGYSILTSGGRVLRDVSDLSIGSRFEARLADGTLEATIEKITKKPE